jgi:hypothetical protein
MGRGLSDQQQAILLLAYKNRLKFGIVLDFADIYPWEILTRYHRWLPFPNSAYSSQSEVLQLERAAALRWRRNNAGVAVFSKQDIGAAQFNRVMASLYRSFNRLVARGLMQDCGAGKRLTEEGIALVPSLPGLGSI